MKPPKLRMISPVWAQQIDVDRQGDTLLLTGWGRIPDPVGAQDVEPEYHARLDIFQRFHRYVLRHLGEGQTTEDAGVYQLADANTDEKLVAFVQEFGPVWGDVRSSRNEENGTVTITVAQSMRALRRDQQEFAATVDLLQQVNRNRHADIEILQAKMLELELIPHELAMTAVYENIKGTAAQKTAAALAWAHRGLCFIFNSYRPLLTPLDGEVIELPEMHDEGIRHEIYYQLRRDYLAQREIGTCVKCGGHFPIHKKGARGCSESCRRALRNQKYWNRYHKTINRNRRQQRAGRR